MSTYNVFVDETRNEVIVNEDAQTIIIKDTGGTGSPGVGVPSGGTAGQYLRKQSGTDYDTAFATISADEVTEGATNKFYTDERVDDRVATLLTAGSNVTLTYNDPANTLTIAATGITDHTALSNIGTNTHAQIDTHIANTSNPHSVTAAQAGAVALTGNESVAGIKSFTSYPQGPATSPTLPAELVDKQYVDALVTTGARFVDAVDAATVSALPANTYNNGASGVGATLTGNSNGAFPSIDGVAPVLNRKYLIKDESTQANNGAYSLTQVGDGSNPYILTRIPFYNESSEIVTGTFFTVVSGTVNGNQQWAMNQPNPITVGTTAIIFAQLSAPPTITASLGAQKVGNDIRANLSASGAITLSGNSLQVNPDNSSIEISSNALQVKALGVTNAMLAGSIADSKLNQITTASKVSGSAVTGLTSVPAGAGALPAVNGGTGQTSYSTGDILYATSSTTVAKLGIGPAGTVVTSTGTAPAWQTPVSGGGGLTSITYNKCLETESSAITVTNTVTESTIYTYSVAANALGTNKIINGIIKGTYLNNSGATRTVRVRVKYGATTILDKTTAAIAANAATGAFYINFFLANQNATNVQEGYLYASFESGANTSVNIDDRGVAAIDSTSIQSLVVTVQMSAATATQTLVKRLAVLNMLNATDNVGGVSLKTNGVANGLQTTLDITQGTGITATDSGSGVVTIASTITQYTDALAKSAAVADAINNGTTDVAPSQNAVFDALALKYDASNPSSYVDASGAKAAAVSDTAYDATSWNGVTDVAPSKNAVRDQIETMNSTISGIVADAINDGVTTIAPSQNAVFDALALKAPLASPALTGTPTAPTASPATNNTQIATTAYADALVSDTAYNATSWDGVTGIAPSKNAVRDQIESLSSSISGVVSDTAYDATSWDGVTTIAPSKNAVRDKIQTLMPISGGTFTGAVVESVVTLTDAATIAVDATLGNIFTVTLGGNRTLGNPTGAVNGQKLVFRVRQDGTGSRTLSYDTKFRFGTDIPSITLTTTAGKTDYIGVMYHSADDKFDVLAVTKGL